MNEIIPKNDRVLVRVLPEAEKDTNGLIAINQQQSNFVKVKVKKLANTIDDSEIDVGDTVLVPRFRLIQTNTADLKLIRYKYIEAKVFS